MYHQGKEREGMYEEQKIGGIPPLLVRADILIGYLKLFQSMLAHYMIIRVNTTD